HIAALSGGTIQIAALAAPLPIQRLRREGSDSIVCRRTRGALYRLFFIGPRRLGHSPRPQWLVRVVNLRTVDGECRPDRRGRLDSRIRRRYCLGRLRCRRLPGVVRTLNGGPERKTRNAHDDGDDARLHNFFFPSRRSLESDSRWASAGRFAVIVSGEPPARISASTVKSRWILPDVHSHRLGWRKLIPFRAEFLRSTGDCHGPRRLFGFPLAPLATASAAPDTGTAPQCSCTYAARPEE